ncbi:MAG: hypothetical protein HY940_08770 [Gammaproteobacteria bacterium]|nr:hypothetical protein [Gammaproteobacteria bacterium]
MHPLIRIVFFLVLVIGLAYAGPLLVMVTAAALAAAMLVQREWWVALRGMLRRIRWLMLTIFLIYLWMTPGAPLLEEWNAAWMPSREGVLQGGLRILSLLAVVMAVTVLLAVTTRRQLCAALYQLVTPLRVLGLSRERFALRMLLVLETLPRIERELGPLLAASKPAAEAMGAARVNYSAALQRIAERMGALVQRIHAEAEQEPLRTLSLELLPAPLWYEWLPPLGLAAVLWWL